MFAIVEIVAIVALGVIGGDAAPAYAKERPAVVLVGSAWGPEGNQVSLETQVEALKDALGPRLSTLLFAAGSNADVRSVQVEDLESLDEATDLLGLVFARPQGLFVQYRPSKIRGAGVASKAGFLSAIQEASRRSVDVVVFAVGHGTPATEEQPAAIELWGADDQLYVDELAQFMDRKAAPKGMTAFVLGHCHSGAFADVMYVRGDQKESLAPSARCVFAAVPSDREAAGCTPDVNDPSAEAYMAQIAHALGRQGVADYDGDGAVSLAEAHAYAKIQDPTIDLPVSTSEVWLEALPSGPDAVPNDWTVSRLMAEARASERAVLTALGPDTAGKMTLGAMAEALEREKDALERTRRALDDAEADREQLRRQILNAVLLRWPELSNPYHPVSRRILSAPSRRLEPDPPQSPDPRPSAGARPGADARPGAGARPGDSVRSVGMTERRSVEDGSLIDVIKKRPELREIERLDRQLTIRANAVLRQEKDVVRKERWLRTALYVAREQGIRRRGRTNEVAQLDAILACESMTP
ncbi:MAG: hypothetical protein IPK13_01760 [Deltaproteobacteria bacterium]|nr:hypothetical protein [Deltaproteobacteria bacterium]